MLALIALAALIGLIAGCACAAAMLRRSRERMREQLSALSSEVLASTGETLAQRPATPAAPKRSAPPARWPGAPRRSRASCGPSRRS